VLENALKIVNNSTQPALIRFCNEISRGTTTLIQL